MTRSQREQLTREVVQEIGIEGYVYLYSLVTMEITRRQLTNGPAGAQPGRGPMGVFQHIREFPAADFKAVVRPNFDTLYSSAWLDVRAEPLIVCAPASPDRYYLLPCYDMWTDAFTVPGTRTTGPGPLAFALTHPDWQGSLPEGILRFDAPTPYVWIIGRTQTNGPDDYEAVHAFQDLLTITPLSSWGATPPVPAVVDDAAVDTRTPPLDQVNAMTTGEFFALASELVATHRPHLSDGSILARLARIGFRVGEHFRLDAQDALVRDALSGVPAGAQAAMGAAFPLLAPVVNGWLNPTQSMGTYGNSYMKRAVVAMVGLGANPQEDAIYPVLQTDADGEPLEGTRRYVIHFAAGELPPADAFWSVTMYDAAGFQSANELNRFAIGDRDPLVTNRDGSLDLYLQHDNPGPDKVANWLPAPVGPLGVTMRIYRPRQEALNGAWSPPSVRRIS